MHGQQNIKIIVHVFPDIHKLLTKIFSKLHWKLLTDNYKSRHVK